MVGFGRACRSHSSFWCVRESEGEVGEREICVDLFFVKTKFTGSSIPLSDEENARREADRDFVQQIESLGFHVVKVILFFDNTARVFISVCCFFVFYKPQINGSR